MNTKHTLWSAVSAEGFNDVAHDAIVDALEEKFNTDETVQMTVQEFIDNVIKESIKCGK